MAKSRITTGKKNLEKKRQSKKREKEQKREARKANSNKGKGIEHMMAYVDEFGRITSEPPDPAKFRSVKAEDIPVGVPKQEHTISADEPRIGTVVFFNEAKGYGFIIDSLSQEKIFVHISDLETEVKPDDRVSFMTRRGPRGNNAINVKPVDAS